jgi:N-glycosylase/DNA lyase
MKKLISEIKPVKGKTEKQVKKALRELRNNYNLSTEKMFIEMCFCIIVANSSIQKALRAYENIGDNFLKFNKQKLSQALKNYGVRFYNNKAKYIIYSRKLLKTIHRTISTTSDAFYIRKWLVKNIKGLGYKEASHFLRNLGFTNFAILDRHILKILRDHKIIQGIKTLTPRKYLETEQKLKKFADKLHINLAELDIYMFYLDTQKIPER